jgi:putative transposase
MSTYRRAFIAGGTYFFTVVTFQRQRFLTNPQCLSILREAIAEVRQRLPFTVDAWVLLPDHMHCIWTLPPNDADFSKRWGLIKAIFSRRIKPFYHKAGLPTASQTKN